MKKKLILFLIFILAIGSVIAYDGISMDNLETNCEYSYGTYKYTADYNLTGIDSNDLKSVTYFYFDDGEVKNCTKMLYSDEDKCEVSAECYFENRTDVDHIEIAIFENDTVLFNQTHDFKMPVEENNNNNKVEDSTSTKTPQHTYVASVNSDKFHEPSCRHAKKIKDGNKITFSNRDEAVNSGYSPCRVCYP